MQCSESNTPVSVVFVVWKIFYQSYLSRDLFTSVLDMAAFEKALWQRSLGCRATATLWRQEKVD